MADNIKISRYESIILTVINNSLKLEIDNKVLKFATATSVKLTKDLSLATVFLDCLDRNKIENVVFEANRLKGFFKGKLSKVLKTYKTPNIKFVVDEVIDYVDNIEKLFKEINEEKK